MRVLITGGSGFIGRAVAVAALAAGHDVRALDLVTDHVPDGAEPVVGDVRDADVVRRALAGVDAVSHQAAKVGLGVDMDDLPRYASSNDVGTAALLAGMARAGVGRLVLASSMVVYGEGRYRCAEHGDVAAPPRTIADLRAGRFEPRCPRCSHALRPALVGEDAVPDPRNGYAVSKLAQEQYTRVWSRETGGTCIALRYHNVYGPGLPRNTPYAGVAAIFGSALAAHRAPRVFEDGGQRRDFVHVRDVAAANLAALEATAPSGTPDLAGHGTPDPGDDGTRHPPAHDRAFNVASGTPRTVLDLATALADVVDGRRPVVTGEFRLGDVRHVTASTERIRAELGWRPAVDFDEGIKELALELVTRA
jgi:dTDP-L-rhamnose 4-epimerase